MRPLHPSRRHHQALEIYIISSTRSIMGDSEVSPKFAPFFGMVFMPCFHYTRIALLTCLTREALHLPYSFLQPCPSPTMLTSTDDIRMSVKEKSIGRLETWLMTMAEQVQEQHMAPPRQASASQE